MTPAPEARILAAMSSSAAGAMYVSAALLNIESVGRPPPVDADLTYALRASISRMGPVTMIDQLASLFTEIGGLVSCK
jgi:hypothetical protein